MSNEVLAVEKHTRPLGQTEWLVRHVPTGQTVFLPGCIYFHSDRKWKAEAFRDYLLAGGWNWSDWDSTNPWPEWANAAREYIELFTMPKRKRS